MNKYQAMMRVISCPLLALGLVGNLLARPSVAQSNAGLQTTASFHLHPGKFQGTGTVPTSHTARQADLRPGAAANFTPSLANNLPKPAITTGTSSDWATYGFNNQRTGYNPKELNSSLSPSTASGLHQLWVADLGGAVSDAQPVYAHNVNINGTSTDLLYVGTEDGVFHAINASTGQQIWSRQLGTAIAYEGCGGYETGITGSAVLDRGKSYSDRVYIVDGQNNVYALNLADGSIIWGPVNAGDPGNLHVYNALTVSGSSLYVTRASYCDAGKYGGAVVQIVKIGTARPLVYKTFLTTNTEDGGGIWGAGGASVDPVTQNIFVATGNSVNTPGTQHFGYAENVVGLSKYLDLVGSNYPSAGLYRDDTDSDFGATPILYDAPATGCKMSMLAAENKSGSLLVYDRNNIQNGQMQDLQLSYPTDYGQFIGVPGFSPETNYLYVSNPQSWGIYTNGMLAFKIKPDCTLDPSPVWQTTAGANGTGYDDDPYSPPTVANGVVYMADGLSGDLFAFDASNGTKLFTAGSLGPAFVAPIVVDSKVYIGTYSNKLYSFGL